MEARFSAPKPLANAIRDGWTISATDGGEDNGYGRWCSENGRICVNVKPYPKEKSCLLLFDCRGRAPGMALQVLLKRLWRLADRDVHAWDREEPGNFVVGPFTLRSLEQRIAQVLALIADPAALQAWFCAANGSLWRAPMPACVGACS